jgi:hypothetical protein
MSIDVLVSPVTPGNKLSSRARICLVEYIAHPDSADKETALSRLQQRQFWLIADIISELEQWDAFKPPPPAVRDAMRAVHSAVKKQQQKTKHKRKMTKASRRKNHR